MRVFSDDELDGLISCVKYVADPPRREMRIDGKMKRNEMTLKSSDETNEFRVFMRQSDDFPENFSIGLVFLPGEDPGEVILIRYNGRHGGTRQHPHHGVFHTHRMKADDLNAGIKEARVIEETKDYASFEEALRVFLRQIKLDSPDTYFPGLNQPDLFPKAS